MATKPVVVVGLGAFKPMATISSKGASASTEEPREGREDEACNVSGRTPTEAAEHANANSGATASSALAGNGHEDESLDIVFNRRDTAAIDRKVAERAATSASAAVDQRSHHVFDDPNVFS